MIAIPSATSAQAVAQTAAEFDKMSATEQRAVVDRHIANFVRNLSARRLRGQDKPEDVYQQHRRTANLTRALFLPDKSKGVTKKETSGVEQLIAVIRNAAQRKPDAKISDVMLNYVRSRYQRYYKGPDEKFVAMTDEEQEAWFRTEIDYQQFKAKFEREAPILGDILRESLSEAASNLLALLLDGKSCLRMPQARMAHPDKGQAFALDSAGSARYRVFNMVRDNGRWRRTAEPSGSWHMRNIAEVKSVALAECHALDLVCANSAQCIKGSGTSPGRMKSIRLYFASSKDAADARKALESLIKAF